MPNAAMTLDILLADTLSLTLPTHLEATLSASSQGRLAQLSTPMRRQQFLLGRWLMSQAAGCELAGIEEGSDYPVFSHEPDLHASISHSGSYIGVVISKHGRCGLDIEHPTRQRDWRALAERAFSPREAAWIGSAAPDKQVERFHRLWTLRESAFKAGLLSSVVAKECLFDPELDQHIGDWHWQYLQHGKLYLSAACAAAFDIAVHAIALPIES